MYAMNGRTDQRGEASPFMDAPVHISDIQTSWWCDGGEEIGNPIVPAADSSKAAWSRSMPTLLTSASEGAKKRAGQFLNLGNGDGHPVDIDTKIVRKYLIICGGRLQEITLAHAESVWYVKMDSQVLATKSHNNASLRGFRTSTEFQIPDNIPGDGSLGHLTAKMTMEWVPLSMRWQYTLLVGNTIVPTWWSKAHGFVENPEVPEVDPSFHGESSYSPLDFRCSLI